MASIIISKVGERKGTHRIWFEGEKLSRAGFDTGSRYRVDTSKPDRLILIKTKTEERSRVVSGRKRGGRSRPIIDLNNKALGKLFSVNDKLRIVIRRNKVVIRLHRLIGEIAKRFERFRQAITEKRPLAVHSHYHGGGVLDSAIHSGLAMAGVGSYVQVAIEKERDYLDTSLRQNPELFTDESILIEGGIEDVKPCNSVPFDVLVCGLPCVAFSNAGKAKMRDLRGGKRTFLPEESDTAGALFFYTLRHIIDAGENGPGIIIIECVPGLVNSASMAVIRTVLTHAGFTLQERILGGNEFGALEDRQRVCVVAVSNGLEDVVDLGDVPALSIKPKTLSEVLESVPDDSDMWSEMPYLAAKEIRDKEQGKGFLRQLFDGSEEKIGVVTRLYQKRRSTDPMIRHPSNPALSRLLTPAEHCAVKSIPSKQIDDDSMSNKLKHEILGQSVIFPAFEAVGYAIGRQLRSAFGEPATTPVAA